MRNKIGILLFFGVLSLCQIPISVSGGGSVTTTGSPASGNLTKFSGSTTITNADLAGDCTTSGTTTVTCTKTNNVSFANSATTDTTNATNISSGTLSATRVNWNLFSSTIAGITVANWTTFNGGSCTRTDFASGGPASTGAIKMVGSNTATATNLCGVFVAQATGSDYTRTLVVAPMLDLESNSEVSVGFSDGTKYEGCGFLTVGTVPQVSDIEYTNTGTVGGSASGGSATVWSVPNFIGGLVIQLKWTQSSTTMACLVSYDGGVTFKQRYSNASVNLTPTRIYVGVDPRHASSVFPSEFTLLSYQ